MATVNNRLKTPQASAINGVDAGGTMTAVITEGYENVMRSAPDGLQLSVIDREVQFVRGVITCQDWVEAVNLLTGAVSTYVFYERKSGVAVGTGYIKHTLTNPVIHRMTIRLAKGGFAVVEFAFECRAADEAETIADMHAMVDDQAAPTYITAARGGYRVITTKHTDYADPTPIVIDINHVTAFEFSLTLPLVKECNDIDLAYTCVDADLSGMTAAGSIGFQDSEIATAKLKCQQMLLAAEGDLVLTVLQSRGATNKVITISHVIFLSAGENSDVNTPFTGYTAQFDIANDPATPLTLEGTDKIITIADAT